MCSCPKSLEDPYYCSSHCRIEVKGPRELAFFRGKAVGPVYLGFCYESEAGAHAAPIAFRPSPHASSGSSSGTRYQKWLTGSAGRMH